MWNGLYEETGGPNEFISSPGGYAEKKQLEYNSVVPGSVQPPVLMDGLRRTIDTVS